MSSTQRALDCNNHRVPHGGARAASGWGPGVATANEHRLGYLQQQTAVCSQFWRLMSKVKAPSGPCSF